MPRSQPSIPLNNLWSKEDIGRVCMKACLTPKTITKGDVFYSFDAFSFDDGSSSVEAHEWHVRSLRTRPTWCSRCGMKELVFTREARFIGLASKKLGVTFCDSKWVKNIPKALKLNEELKDRLPEGSTPPSSTTY